VPSRLPSHNYFLGYRITVSTIKHAENKNKENNEFLKPSQTSVMTADHPIFVLAKQIPGQWQGIYGEENSVIMLGCLHREIISMKLFGNF
jgi:hypothetical protein